MSSADRRHVAVISHRRSGTHFTIDAIRSNFRGYRGGHVDLDHLRPAHPDTLTVEAVRHRASLGPTVFKSHMHADPGRFYGELPLSRFVTDLLGSSKVIYVHRDGRDMLVSLYFYASRFDPSIRSMTFGQFIRMSNHFDRDGYDGEMDRVAYWSRHADGWLRLCDGLEMLPVGFADLHDDYEATIRRIGGFLDLPPRSKIRRVRRRPVSGNGVLARQIEKLRTRLTSRFSTVDFRRGVCGEYKERFTESDLKFFDEGASETMRRLGYYR